MKKIVRGNDLTLQIPVSKMVDGALVDFALPACTDIVVNLVSLSKRYSLDYTVSAEKDNVILASVKSADMPTCKMALEVRGKIFGAAWRSNEYEQIQFVDNNAEGDTSFDVDDGEQSVEMDTAVVVLAPSDNLTQLVDEAEKAVSECKSATDTATSAESERVTAEEARKAAETDRVNAEAARVSAEETRKSVESERQTAEAARVTAESGRAGKEVTRVEAETSRQSAENVRTQEEKRRDENEDARKTAEAARINAEDERESGEAERNSNEDGRTSAETKRISAEKDRANAESVRVSNEAARANAETLRAHAEEKRVEAETAREKAMTDTIAKCVAAATLKVSYNAEKGTIDITTEQ
jgi:hypothetical protein